MLIIASSQMAVAQTEWVTDGPTIIIYNHDRLEPPSRVSPDTTLTVQCRASTSLSMPPYSQLLAEVHKEVHKVVRNIYGIQDPIESLGGPLGKNKRLALDAEVARALCNLQQQQTDTTDWQHRTMGNESARASLPAQHDGNVSPLNTLVEVAAQRAASLEKLPQKPPPNGSALTAESIAGPSTAPKRIHLQPKKHKPKKKKRIGKKGCGKGGKGGWNAYNIFKSHTKHCMTEGDKALELDDYVTEHLQVASRSYKDKHTRSMCKHGETSVLGNVEKAFKSWKESAKWQGRDTNLVKTNALLNARWGDLTDAQKKPYQDALARLPAKKP